MMFEYDKEPINSCPYDHFLVKDKNVLLFGYSYEGIENNLEVLKRLVICNSENLELVTLCNSFLENIPQIYTDCITKTGPHINGLPVCLFLNIEDSIDLSKVVPSWLIEMSLDHTWNIPRRKDLLHNPTPDELSVQDVVVLGPGNNFCGSSRQGLHRKPYLYTLPNNSYSLLYYKFKYYSK